MKQLVLIPAYNEAKTIGDVIDRVWSQNVDAVIVIDDGSTDNTREIAEVNADVLVHQENKGQGSALRKGFEYVNDNFRLDDLLIVLDGDGQHWPEDIPKFIRAIEEGSEHVIGVRSFETYPLRKKVGNKLLSLVASTLCDYKFNDITCGFHVMRNYVNDYFIEFNLPQRYGSNVMMSMLSVKKFKVSQVEINSQVYRKDGMSSKQAIMMMPVFLKAYLNQFKNYSF